jgi:hypothetical protein
MITWVVCCTTREGRQKRETEKEKAVLRELWLWGPGGGGLDDQRVVRRRDARPGRWERYGMLDRLHLNLCQRVHRGTNHISGHGYRTHVPETPGQVFPAPRAIPGSISTHCAAHSTLFRLARTLCVHWGPDRKRVLCRCTTADNSRKTVKSRGSQTMLFLGHFAFFTCFLGTPA